MFDMSDNKPLSYAPDPPSSDVRPAEPPTPPSTRYNPDVEHLMLLGGTPAQMEAECSCGEFNYKAGMNPVLRAISQHYYFANHAPREVSL